jgi:hypothetical protein
MGYYIQKFTLLLGAMCCLADIHSNAEPIETPERVVIGERALPDDEQWLAKVQQVKRELNVLDEFGEEGYDQRDSSIRMSCELPIGLETNDRKVQTAVSKKSVIKKNVGQDETATVYLTSHAGALHRPISVSIFGDKVELEDGSTYTIRPADRLKVLNWLTSDAILIVPPAFFSSYQYALINQNTGCRVEVNLTLGPIFNGHYTHWVIALDRELGRICLEDGSIWEIFCLDLVPSKRWMIGDTVIMGINDGWFSGSKPNVLINVNLNEYIKAKCLY